MNTTILILTAAAASASGFLYGFHRGYKKGLTHGSLKSFAGALAEVIKKQKEIAK